MTMSAHQPGKARIRVEIKVGRKTVAATFTEFHLSVVVAEAAAAGGARKHVTKVRGFNKTADVTMKRGVISDLGLSDWVNEVRGGKSKYRDVVVVISKQGPGRAAARWKLKNVRIIKYTGPSLTGKRTDVAIEELVLACEDVELA